MKTLFASILAAIATTIAGVAAVEEITQGSQSAAVDSRCFEMRAYYAAPGKLEALNARFRNHTCALFRKQGMEIIGFWMPVDKEPGAENKLLYILAHKSREGARKSFLEFSNDPEWKKVRAESEVNGRLVAKVESVFMSVDEDGPEFDRSVDRVAQFHSLSNS